MSNDQTLRDTFAAAALTGVLAGRLDRVEESHADVWAHMAGMLADAMLRERARNGAVEGRDQPPPTLTDAEREAVSIAAQVIGVASEPHAATLRALLARMGGAS